MEKKKPAEAQGSQTRMVKCPECGKPSAFTPENQFRPFCSERCRILDLGSWASESYRIAPRPDSSADEENSDDTENIN